MIITPWTDQEHRRLVMMVNQGLSAHVIAHRLGRTKNSIIGCCHRQGITLAKPKQGASRPKASYQKRENGEVRSVIGMHTVRRERKRSYHDGLVDTSQSLPPTTTLSAVGAHACRFVAVVSQDSTLCGRPALHKQAWCAYHRSLVYKPNSTGKVTL